MISITHYCHVISKLIWSAGINESGGIENLPDKKNDNFSNELP